MTPEQFTYWLQGFIEMNAGKEPTKHQWKIINDHLKTVFHKETPNYAPPSVPQPQYSEQQPFDTPYRIIC